MSEAEVQAWVEAARQGDELALEQIFHHYKTALFNLARQLVRDPDDAEDVVQKTFIKAFRSLSRIRDPAKLGTWLRRITYTTCMDTLRKRKRRGEQSLDDRLYVRSAPALNPEKEAMFQERVDMVDQALQRMSPRYRAYIVLREFEGLKYDQIAELLGEPASTVRPALHRARQQLRELVQQMAGEDEI